MPHTSIRCLPLAGPLLALALLGGCASTYTEPYAAEPAATVVGKVERRGKGMGWYRQTFVSEVDGAVIPPAGIHPGEVPVRVRPGRHRLGFTVGFRHGGSDELDCPCIAGFSAEVELQAAQRIVLESSLDPQGVVRLRLVDKANGRPLLPELQAQARSARQR